MEAKKKWYVPPSFSVEFAAYFHDRTNRVEELRKSLEEQLKRQSQLREREAEHRPKFDVANKQCDSAKEDNQAARQETKDLRDVLERIAPGRLRPTDVLKPLMKPVDIVTPNIRAKTTMWAAAHSAAATDRKGKKNLTKSERNQMAQVAAAVLHSPVHEGGVVSLKTCATCGLTVDQHLLVRCDSCRNHYHLGCLNPPLTRMPKKSRLYGWHCSHCGESSSEKEEEPQLIVEGPRRQRQAAARAKFASRQNSDHEEEWQQLPPTPPKKKSVPNGKIPNGGGNHVEEGESAEDAAGRENLIQAEDRKYKKRLDRERRKAEKKKRRAEKRKKREAEREATIEIDDDDEEENECEIIEQEDGQVIVNIKPKAIKLKIKATSSPGNHLNGGDDDLPSSAKRLKPSSNTNSSSRNDLRTKCDVCGQAGDNSSLVRCDDCKRCFHFACLTPPLKKSPKVPGWGWSCHECAPSEVDSDWHLD